MNKNKEIGLIEFETFSRTGQVLTPMVKSTQQPTRIVDLSGYALPESDSIVRQVESDFAPVYDLVQFISPGMKFMAETDTILLQEWLGNIQGKRILDIGAGTGRITLPMAEAVGEKGKVYAVDIARPYLEVLTDKARRANIPTSRLNLAVADIQSVPTEWLVEFLEGGQLDNITLWFGAYALMTSDPFGVMSRCNELLKPGGSLTLTTNGLNGIAYRYPERAIKQGADPELPLGYRPSIYTKRAFLDVPESFPGADIPRGLILGNGEYLPAIFYTVPLLQDILEKTGFEVVDSWAISRLTGLYPALPDEKGALEKYIQIVEEIEPWVAEKMEKASNNPEAVLELARFYDLRFGGDERRRAQYNYPAIKAVKPLR